MLRYVGFAVAEKLLSAVPGGPAIYRGLGELAYRRSRGWELPLMQAGVEAVRQALLLLKPGSRVLDLGTGWYYKDALLYALTGRFEVEAYDVQHLARWSYARNYLGLLDAQLPALSVRWGLPLRPMRSRLDAWLECRDLDELRSAARIRLQLAPPDRMAYEDGSLAYVSSYCVLPHIEPGTLLQELCRLQVALRPGGWMHHLIGYADHHSFRDTGVSRLHHYCRGACCQRLLFQSTIQYHNRLLWSDYAALWPQAGLQLVAEKPDSDADSREQAQRLQPRMSPPFRAYPLDELARLHSTVLLRKPR